jgi:hypothetical protein
MEMFLHPEEVWGLDQQHVGLRWIRISTGICKPDWLQAAPGKEATLTTERNGARKAAERLP